MPEIEGRGRNAYETVDAGGTFFVHLSGILLPRIIKLAILGVFTSHVAQDTVWGQESLKDGPFAWRSGHITSIPY